MPRDDWYVPVRIVFCISLDPFALIGWVCSCMACLHNITISVYSSILPLLEISKNDMDKKHCTCSDPFRGISFHTVYLSVYLGENIYIFDIFSRVTGSLFSKYIPQNV